MPKANPTRIPVSATPLSGEEELWTPNQAIEFLAFHDPHRAREAPVYISDASGVLRASSPDWPPEVVTGVWGLWRALEDGVVTPIEHGRPIPSSSKDSPIDQRIARSLVV